MKEERKEKKRYGNKMMEKKEKRIGREARDRVKERKKARK